MSQTIPTKPRPGIAPALKSIETIDDYDLRENATAIQLGAEQGLNQTRQRVAQMLEEGKSFRSPSKLKYLFLFGIGGLVDLVDFADLTGIGILLSKIVSLGGTTIIYFTFWLTNGQTKRAEVYSDDALSALVAWQQSVSQYSQLAMRTSKMLRQAPGLRGVARSIPRAMVKVRRIARRNPITKILVGGAINLIPWLAIVNLMVFWIYLSYRDEKRTFKEARDLSEQVGHEIERPEAA